MSCEHDLANNTCSQCDPFVVQNMRDRLEAEVKDARQDLAFSQRDHRVTILRARRFELGLGVLAAMLDASHPGQDVIRGVLADPNDPGTRSPVQSAIAPDTKGTE